MRRGVCRLAIVSSPFLSLVLSLVYICVSRVSSCVSGPHMPPFGRQWDKGMIALLGYTLSFPHGENKKKKKERKKERKRGRGSKRASVVSQITLSGFLGIASLAFCFLPSDEGMHHCCYCTVGWALREKVRVCTKTEMEPTEKTNEYSPSSILSFSPSLSLVVTYKLIFPLQKSSRCSRQIHFVTFVQFALDVINGQEFLNSQSQIHDNAFVFSSVFKHFFCAIRRYEILNIAQIYFVLQYFTYTFKLLLWYV